MVEEACCKLRRPAKLAVFRGSGPAAFHTHTHTHTHVALEVGTRRSYTGRTRSGVLATVVPYLKTLKKKKSLTLF